MFIFVSVKGKKEQMKKVTIDMLLENEIDYLSIVHITPVDLTSRQLFLTRKKLGLRVCLVDNKVTSMS